MKSWVLPMLLLLSVQGSTPALASPPAAIEIFRISEGSGEVDFGSCQGTSHHVPGEGVWTDWIDLSVQARLAGPATQGIGGAALYVDGLESLPPGTFRCAEANYSAAVTVGDPVKPYVVDGALCRRAAIAWKADPSMAECQTGAQVEDSRYVQLYTLTLLRPMHDLPQDLTLRVVGSTPALYPALSCPTLILCDYPTFTALCVAGGEFIVNPVERSCTVTRGTTAAEPATWGKVKSLYRDAVR